MCSLEATGVDGEKKWLGMEGSNLRFLIQSQASYHWTNPQRRGGDFPFPEASRNGLVRRVALKVYSIVLSGRLAVK